jgi:cyclophilin family peptidyl-prolyl cis-trans isomerase
MNNRNLIISIIVIVLVVVGIWGALRLSKNEQTANQQSNNENTEQTMEDTKQNADATNQEVANTEPVPSTVGCKRNFDENKLKTAAVDTKNKFVTLDITNFGQIKIQLYDTDAPKTVENFLRLVNSGYYDCITFHRIAQGFVIQAGDPTGTGSGGQSAFGAEFADELNPQTVSYKTGYKKGVVAMANRGPNTNTSQFFIMLEDKGLANNYTIFGKVVSGQDTVDKIGKLEVEAGVFGAGDGAPKEKVVISKAVISSK